MNSLINSKAPEFNIMDASGNKISLSDFKGKWDPGWTPKAIKKSIVTIVT